MRKVTRRQIQAWLQPIRSCMKELRGGEVSCIRGYPVTRLNGEDEYARVDFCLAGFRALLARLCPEIMSGQLERIEKKLANGAPLTVAEIDDALALLRRCEDALIRHSVDAIKSAVLTEQCVIEMDSLRKTA